MQVTGDLPCPSCGYNLRGSLLSRGCPECGRRVAFDRPQEGEDAPLADIEAEIAKRLGGRIARRQAIGRLAASWEARGRRLDALLDRMERWIERQDKA